ncbi:unnamed protein product [Closterium sp. NIES-64]|nr:unnamed protein product [Closterium sp. NIES-64]
MLIPGQTCGRKSVPVICLTSAPLHSAAPLHHTAPTSTQQRALFTFTVTAVPISPAPVFSNSSYHTNAGQLVATFACVPKPTIMLGIYQCTASSLANITVPFRPVNRPKALVDAGLFSNPSGFYSTISVNGVSLRGGITTSVANLAVAAVVVNSLVGSSE